MIRQCLSKISGEVYECGGGAAALAAFERHRLELTLMDVKMPLIDGILATRRIRVVDGGGENNHRHRSQRFVFAAGSKKGGRVSVRGKRLPETTVRGDARIASALKHTLKRATRPQVLDCHFR